MAETTWAAVLRADAEAVRREAREYDGVGYRDGARRLRIAAEHAAALAADLECITPDRIDNLEEIIRTAPTDPAGAERLRDVLRVLAAGPQGEAGRDG